MSTMIALQLYAAAFLPFGLAAWRPTLLPTIVGGASTMIVALCFVQSGMLQQGKLASTDVSSLVSDTALTARCEQVIDALVQAGVATGRPGRGGFVVNGKVWDQLPKAIQNPVLSCAQELAAPANPTSEIKLIRR